MLQMILRINYLKKLLSQNQDKAKTIIAKYTELSSLSNNMFYFSQDDLNKYFDLKGINDVVIDFSTRKVYSVEGIKDPDDKDKLYFISSEWGGDTRVSSTANTPTTVNASSFTSTKSGSYYNVTIILDKVIDVSEVYAKVNDKTIKRDEFRVSKTATNTTVYFTVESTGTYTFRFVDSSKRVYEITGKTIS